ncbi:MAG: M20/M25/M40 family metallo-hydrolase [Promethearchaeota archaeon]
MSLENISEDSLEEFTSYIMEKIIYIVNEFGDRYPGSKGENDAHMYLKEELNNYVDEIQMEPFKVPPKAFMSFLPIAGILMLISIAIYWISPLFALLLDLLVIMIVVLHFLLYKKILDPFFPKQTSYNLLGKRKALEEPKRSIIFSGHVDAAFEWRYSKVNPILVRIILIPAILGIGIKLIIDLLATIFNPNWNSGYGSFWGAISIVGICFIPVIIAILFFTNFSVVSPGASDNLSGTLMAVAIAKYLHEQSIKFAETEVQFLLTGSEEAGLRGAKVYCKKHLDELKRSNSVFIGLESFCELEHMAINDKDLNGLVENDPAVCQLLKIAAMNCGHELKYQKVYIGATDAAAFSQAGIPASTIEAMDPAPPRWYHTRYDNLENLRPETIKVGFKISLEALNIFNKVGLPSL